MPVTLPPTGDGSFEAAGVYGQSVLVMPRTGVTIVRLAATRGRMLEWETAAASAERGRHRAGFRAFVRAMIASPLIALLGVAMIAAGAAIKR